MQKIIVLGGGMVGSVIARDMQNSGYIVTVADIDESIMPKLDCYGVKFHKLDFLSEKDVLDIVKSFDLVIGAVPGFMGRKILELVVKAKRNYVDISFMPEDSKEFTELAIANDITVLTDAGVAPGLSNLLFGRALSEYDHLNLANCYVGGLPQNPEPPWLYKSVFSPIDVIEEYTRPARFVKDGKIVTKPAMTDLESIDFEGIGQLDAFNSDGLRSLMDLPIPNMVEKTLRYPGHIQKIIEMRDKGLLESDKINETASKLISAWEPSELDYDQTILRVEFAGIKDGKEKREVYDLIDRYDQENNVSSMARTTGYTCTACASLLLSGKFLKKGLFNLESLGQDPELVNLILLYLSDRNVNFEF
jgi:lysine 6-dehydrogenase